MKLGSCIFKFDKTDKCAFTIGLRTHDPEDDEEAYNIFTLKIYGLIMEVFLPYWLKAKKIVRTHCNYGVMVDYSLTIYSGLVILRYGADGQDKLKSWHLPFSTVFYENFVPKEGRWIRVSTYKNTAGWIDTKELAGIYLFKWRYVTRGGEVQDANVQAYLCKTVFRRRGLMWLPLETCTYTANFEFDREMGEMAGTYKGGVVRLHTIIDLHESYEQCLARVLGGGSV